jgi:hypothetical protein
MPQARAIFLGASNLTRGLPAFVDAARLVLDAPIDVLAAAGHGRSYGTSSSVLGRRLCGITESGLWQDLAAKAPLPLYALITDIGNDIVYGVPVERILDWVSCCFDRLERREARIIATELPLATIRGLGPRRFALMRRALFPSCGLSLSEAKERSEEVNDAVVHLAQSRGICLVPQDPHWFGLDPIHIRRRLIPFAAVRMLSRWREESRQLDPPRPSFLQRAYFATRAPYERQLLGIDRRRSQPCGFLRDGTLVSLY